MTLGVPLVCRICGCRCDKTDLEIPPELCIRPGELGALICLDCYLPICPRCGSHDLYTLHQAPIVITDAIEAASVRASVWGRGS